MRSDHEMKSALRACTKGLAAAGVFSLALNLLMLTQPLYMTSIYDRVLSSRSQETLLMLSIAAFGALLVIAILEIVRQIILMRTGARLEAALGGRTLDASLQTAGAGGTDIQGLRDLAHLRQFVASPLMSAVFDAPTAPIYLALVFLIHPHLGFLATGAALLIVAASFLNQSLTAKPLAEAFRHSHMALQTAQAQMRSAELIRAMGMFSNSVIAWGEANARAMVASEVAGRRNAILSGATRLLRLLLQAAILGYGAYLVLTDKTLSGGILFATSMISARALAPLDQVVGGWRSMAGALQSYRRLASLLRANADRASTMNLPRPRASLSAEKLVYSPGPGIEPIIKGLTFSIEPGEAVGIIGPSGSGKSTLARLLVGGLAPTAGLVRIGGDDLRNWSPEALGPDIGYVPQEIELFPATIAQNIARMSLAPDPQKVVEAAQLANCHELIQRLPQGYDTLLGPQGHVLSGGQRQRIALARAFFGRPRIVILDEPNANLDAEGEQALTGALIASREAGMTSVVVTQRTAVVRALSKIMVLKDGRIESFGPRDNVLQGQIRPAVRSTPAADGMSAQAAQRAA